MENERFTAYYKAQNIVPEDEWESFMNSFRQHLPTTFRVAGSRQYVSCRSSTTVLLLDIYHRTANSLNETIKETHAPSLSNVVFEGQRVPPPVQIPWYVEVF